MVEVSKHGIEPVGDVSEGHPSAVGGIGEEGKVQCLVGAVAHIDVLRLHLVIVCQGLFQLLALGIGIQAQVGGLFGIEGSDYPSRGGIGGFVGVELHILLILGLLTRGVRRKIFQCTAEKGGHR